MHVLMVVLQVFLALSNDSSIHVYEYYEAALKVGWMTSVDTADMVLWSVLSTSTTFHEFRKTRFKAQTCVLWVFWMSSAS